MIRVLILDDHRIFAEALCSMFEDETDIEVVASAHTSQEALTAIENQPIDVAVMDIRLKGSDMDGIELAEYLNAHYPSVKVLLLSASVEGRTVARALRYNVSGYMLKQMAAMELHQAILEIEAGNTYYNTEAMEAYHNFANH